MKKTRTLFAVLAVSSVALLTACSDDDKNTVAPVESPVTMTPDTTTSPTTEERVEAIKEDAIAKEKELELEAKIKAEQLKADAAEAADKVADKTVELKDKAAEAAHNIKEAASDAATATGDAIKNAAAKADQAIQDKIGDGKPAPAVVPADK